MTIEELIKAGKENVRKNENLLSAYKNLFKEKFGKEPNCAGCTFNRDWEKLTSSSNNSKIYTMSEKTFLVKKSHDIFTYIVEGKGKVRKPVRSFGYNMTEEFAENYLTIGTPEQLAERKSEFKILPEKFRATQEETSKYPEKLAEMKSFATEKGYDKAEFESISKKSDMISYLETKEIESEDN